MRAELLAPGEDMVGLVEGLRALVPAGDSVSAAVAEILEAVRTGGDRAVLDYTARFDTGGAPAQPLLVADQLLDRALLELDPEVHRGLESAIANVRAVARASARQDQLVELPGGEVIVREAPLDRAAVYVPGGRAPYPSTVVMGVVTALAAGVGEVAVCAPPSRAGEIDPVILAACRLTGARPVYRMGGAHAVAALAFGTETVKPVDIIVGPGNLWVQEAKRQVFGAVAIDGFAGPSDLLVIADHGSAAGPIALDLIAQAEHGPGTLVLGASTSQQLLRSLERELSAAPETGAVARLIVLHDADQARALAQTFAPEHLQLIGRDAEALAGSITHAGSIFVGAAAATAFGDYIVGSNHILPTDGAARFASALSSRTFRRTFTEVRVTDPANLARAAAPVARAEGFEAHARSMEIRIRENR